MIVNAQRRSPGYLSVNHSQVRFDCLNSKDSKFLLKNLFISEGQSSMTFKTVIANCQHLFASRFLFRWGYIAPKATPFATDGNAKLPCETHYLKTFTWHGNKLVDNGDCKKYIRYCTVSLSATQPSFHLSNLIMPVWKLFDLIPSESYEIDTWHFVIKSCKEFFKKSWWLLLETSWCWQTKCSYLKLQENIPIHQCEDCL